MTTSELNFDFADITEELYRDSLREIIIARLGHAARLGWTPDDLRHLTGSAVDPYLPIAHQSVADDAAFTHDNVRLAWHRQIRFISGAREETTIADLETMSNALAYLPPLSDTTILTDLHVLHDLDVDAVDMSAEQRRALQRITGLLKKAESTTFSAEAESLVAKAQQLRQRYRIDHATVSGDLGEVVSIRVRMSAPWVRLQFLLMVNIALANSCRSVITSDIGIATLIGHPDDVRHTAELFASLNHQRDYFMRHSPGAHEAARTGQTSAYRRSFQFTYARRIGELLSTAANDVTVTEQEERSSLPVLARRDRTAEFTSAEIFPHTTRMSISFGGHDGGATDGFQAADSSHLGAAHKGLEGQ